MSREFQTDESGYEDPEPGREGSVFYPLPKKNYLRDSQSCPHVGSVQEADLRSFSLQPAEDAAEGRGEPLESGEWQ